MNLEGLNIYIYSNKGVTWKHYVALRLLKMGENQEIKNWKAQSNPNLDTLVKKLTEFVSLIKAIFNSNINVVIYFYHIKKLNGYIVYLSFFIIIT